MQNFFLQLRSRAPPAARRRSSSKSRSRSRSPSPPVLVLNDPHLHGDDGTSETAEGGVGGSARRVSSSLRNPPRKGSHDISSNAAPIIDPSSSSSTALRSRNHQQYQHRDPESRAPAASSNAPSYVIRPLPWMSPTNHYSAVGTIDAAYGSISRSRSNSSGAGGSASSYGWAPRGPYGTRNSRTHRAQRGMAFRVGSLGRAVRNGCRRLPPGAAVLLCGLAVCVSITILYRAVSWIVWDVLYARNGGDYGALYGGGRHFYSAPQPLDVLRFHEYAIQGSIVVAATANLDREQERAHRLELLQNPRQGRKAAEEEEPYSSYREHRRHVLEKIVPKWLHRNDVKAPTSRDETKGGINAGRVDVDSEPRKLEKAATRTMITLSNMDQHQGNSCPSEIDNVQTTLVIQASPDRMWILKETCRRWHDPIVVVVGVVVNATTNATEPTADASVGLEWNRTVNTLEHECPHLTLLEQEITADPVLYPVNLLRNVALDAVTTSHVLVMDADFVPSTNLHETIRTVLLNQQQQVSIKTTAATGKEDDYVALVVPAFERVDHPPCATPDECKSHLLHNSSYIPQTFTELQSCVLDKNCQVFQLENNWPGHFSTRSGEWLQRQWYEESEENVGIDSNSTTTELLRRIRQVPCFHSLRYEPYVVISWCGSQERDQQHFSKPRAPYYDERFYGYGKNKIEYLQHLRLLGYRFEVLPEGFLVHNPHVDSRAKLDWNAHKSSLHHDMDALYPQFLQELLDHPSMGHSRPIVGVCSDVEKKKKKLQKKEPQAA